MASDALDFADIRSVLDHASITCELEHIVPLRGGANNRVYRLDLKQAPSVVLKMYFQHPQDQRPRLKAEFEFLTYAWQQGIRCIPQPLYQDPHRHLALYSFLKGSQPTAQHAHASFVKAAASFLIDLNQEAVKAQHLLPASDACLKLQDYLHIVDKRLALFLQTPHTTPWEQQFHQFLQQQLLPHWEFLKNTPFPKHLEPSQYILTPSDFGLHNVLLADHQPYFIDFEYAGWDDPAKTICDFFLQPKLPIPFSFFSMFMEQVAKISQDPLWMQERVRQVLPLCAIKWCCIILNVFHPTSHARRAFSMGQNPEIFTQQLQLAEQMLLRAISFSKS